MFEGILKGALWAAVFIQVGAILGVTALLAAASFIPRVVARFTPHLDEEGEIVRGNQAAGTYFGLVVGATILGVSIIIAAAVIAAIHG